MDLAVVFLFVFLTVTKRDFLLYDKETIFMPKLLR